ncbi:hypothetical protein STPYR_11797 [uncultured Stenotrophomonas sp.]|uniref:Uncharacterized protein n=1 Tax=uncultured Stenotrophomonas sp. TaxID=165438 RepID=A0A1Y5Q989_9GAMM|nr:hypothetical protein STPYR_11797 [uncultured Stenotrophomonas sp.]
MRERRGRRPRRVLVVVGSGRRIAGVDAAMRLHQDACDARGLFFGPQALAIQQRVFQLLHRLAHRRRDGGLGQAPRAVAGAGLRGIDHFAVGVDLFAAGVGDRIALAAAVVFGGDQAHVLQQCQRRVDHAGAGCIGAVEQLADQLDQLVAVARLLFDQCQQQQAQVAAAQWPARAAIAAAAPASATPAAPRMGAAVAVFAVFPVATLHAQAMPVRAVVSLVAATGAAGGVPVRARTWIVGARFGIAGMRPVERMSFGAEEGMCVMVMMGCSVLHFRYIDLCGGKDISKTRETP